MGKVIIVKELASSFTSHNLVITHLDSGYGWKNTNELNFDDIEKIIYLGQCKTDGDMFTIYYKSGNIATAKGYLNNGEY